MRPQRDTIVTLADRRAPVEKKFVDFFRSKRMLDPVAIPLLVYRDFIDMLYSMWLPIFGLGIVFAGICIVVALTLNETAYAALAAFGLLTTLWRNLDLRAYRRATITTDFECLRRWEKRYAVGNYALAALLAVFNVMALSTHNPLLQLIAISLAFSFAAGIVARISVRPKICVISLLIVTVPTVLALVFRSMAEQPDYVHAELFLIEAALVAMITGLSLQTVAYLYRTAVEHHTIRHDLAQMAKYDALTGLANRLLLRERFQLSIATTQRSGQFLALYFLDLDGFKSINDQHGHPAGDALLEQVAHRLEAIVRNGDTVARLGGDEFVVLQGALRHEDEAKLLAARIIRRLSEPYAINGNVMNVSVSIGIVMAPLHGIALEQLLGQADVALYEAKSNGKARAMFSTLGDQLDIHAAA